GFVNIDQFFQSALKDISLISCLCKGKVGFDVEFTLLSLILINRRLNSLNQGLHTLLEVHIVAQHSKFGLAQFTYISKKVNLAGGICAINTHWGNQELFLERNS